MLDRTNLYRLHCYEKRTNANLSKEYVDKLSSVARIIIREKDIKINKKVTATQHIS